MRHASEYKLGDPIYTFVANDGENFHIDAAKLRLWCLATKPPIIGTPVNVEMGLSWLRNNTTSFDRCMELLNRSQQSNAVFEPIIYGYDWYGSSDVMLIDGHHRYSLAALCRCPYIPSHLLSVEQWKPFRILGLPKITKSELQRRPIHARNY